MSTLRSLPRLSIVPLGVILAVLAYGASLDGGFLWDDAGHVTPPGLRSVEGLARIWTEPGASQQYYPLLHSTFWGLHKAFGDEPFGYRVVNLLLHAASALLLWRVLERLRVRGAAFIAGLFLVHPVHVETVAWISELKNVLSGVFYLGALLAWVGYANLDEEDVPSAADSSRRRLYVIALALFLCALLSKTVTATWPAVVLVITWWKRGRLDRQRDVVPLVPFFAAGLVMASVTVWAESTLIGARGEEFALSLSERLCIAGRAPWFYATQLWKPVELCFFYPHWELQGALAWSWPLATVALLVALALTTRRIGRAPLASLLIFGGTLFPALGFFNVYPFRYSYAADHFQYLASIALLALAGGGVAAWIEARASEPVRRAAPYAAVIALGLLAWQARVRTAAFENEEALWQDTLAKNPTSAAAHNNLGQLLAESGRVDEAIASYERSIELRPDDPAAYLNLGNAYGQLGRHDEAIASIRVSLEKGPDRPNTWTSLANELFVTGQADEAYEACTRALELDPEFGPAWYNLSAICHRMRRFEEGVRACRRAIDVSPPSPEPWHNLGILEMSRGRPDAAITAFHRALDIAPEHVPARVELARVHQARGELEAAFAELDRALELPGNDVQGAGALFLMRARLAADLGRARLAVEDFERVLDAEPNQVEALARLAWIRATTAPLVDGAEAIRLARRAIEVAGEQPGLLNVLAAALARHAEYEQAVEVATRAEAAARSSGQTELAEAIVERREAYRAGRAIDG